MEAVEVGPDRRWALAATLLLLVGLAVRLPSIADPYSSFFPTRQYRAALIARSLAFDVWGAPSRSEGRLAADAVRQMGWIEPPIEESIGAVLHVEEAGDLWRLRAVGVAAWLAGVAYLGVQLRRRWGDAAGLTAMGLGALLPYGVVASTSLQPEPFLVAAVCVATGLLVAGTPFPERRRHVGFGIATGCAVAFKLTAIPVLLFPYLWAHRRRPRRLADVGIGLGLAVLPTATWFAAGLLFGDFLRSTSSDRILPALVLEARFWTGWGRSVTTVFGVWVLAATAGAVVDRRVRAVVAPAAAGYVVVGLGLPWLISTHDYYTLVAVPLVLVGTGAAVSRLWTILDRERRRVVGVAAGVVTAALALGGLRFAGSYGRSGLDLDAAAVEAVVGRTTEEAVVSSDDYGYGLAYLTHAVVDYWPTAADRSLASLGGNGLADDAAVLADLRARGRSTFVVTVPQALERDPAFAALLARYPVTVCEPAAVLFDLASDGGSGGDDLADCLRRLG